MAKNLNRYTAVSIWPVSALMKDWVQMTAGAPMVAAIEAMPRTTSRMPSRLPT